MSTHTKPTNGWMKSTLMSKLLLCTLMVLAFGVALLMILGAISERTQYRDAARQEISDSFAGAQTVMGPVIMIPYTLGDVTGYDVLYPSIQNTQTKMGTDRRWRGIFPVTVFESDQVVTGQWQGWTTLKGSAIDDSSPRQHGAHDATVAEAAVTATAMAVDAATVAGAASKGKAKAAKPVKRFGTPQIVMAVSDLRGLQSIPTLKLGDKTMALARLQNTWFDVSVGVALSMDELNRLVQNDALSYELKFKLGGTGALGWIPLADSNAVSVQSNWPDPSFGGRFLPATRRITEQGFSAQWNVSSLSSEAQNQLGRSSDLSALESFSVNLVESVDIYHQTERAAKYGLMFIVLTFAAFFTFEMVKRWAIHPMQYLLMGAAMVLFFLLLLSLSEKMAFHWAYLAASCACVGLITAYLSAVLQSTRRALALSLILVVLYGALYGILISQDNALILGSGLLFVALGLVMMLTRHVQWGALKVESPEATAAAAPLAPTDYASTHVVNIAAPPMTTAVTSSQ